jgi:GntR family transcriptional regulator
MLKRAPSLTEQVKSYIKDRIINDEFPDGRIPPELELAEALGVSRTTVRDALSRLEMEGTVLRKQGAGTFVNKPMLQIHTRLDEIWSYEAMLEAHGFQPSTEVLESAALPDGSAGIPDEVLADLGPAIVGDVLRVTKLFRENDVPVILTRNYLPQRSLAGDVTQADLRRPVYELLEQFGVAPLSYYLSEIVPVIASEDVAAALELPGGKPLISFSETGYSADHDPIVKSYSYFRDDLLRLRLMRRRVS